MAMPMIPEQSYPFRGEARQTLRDQQLVAEEIAEVGSAFQVMARRLRPYSKQTLAAIATELARQIQVPSTAGLPTLTPKLPRLAPRYRAAMICWFCKWAPDFPGQAQVQHQTRPSSAQPPAATPVPVPTPVIAPGQDGQGQDRQVREDAPDGLVDDWADYDWGSEGGCWANETAFF
jgi:hypothetical protein